MFQLDDNFLNDVGLGNLPDDQKELFLQHVYEELEMRVGTRLSDGMSDEQLQEFEAIIDKNQQVIDGWLGQFAPQHRTEELFVRMQQSTGLAADDLTLRAEFTATKWLEKNRPHYRDVVAQVLGELKKEIADNRDSILGGDQAEQSNGAQAA